MSGFEVVGVVLGTIPLIVTAIDAYSKFMKDWGRTPLELRSLHRRLTTERSKLYNVCDQLLADVVPLRDVEPMLQEPFGAMWHAPETNARIRGRLADSYEPFQKTVSEMQKALESMSERLRVHVRHDGQVQWENSSRVPREFRKFLYRLDRKDYHDALDTITRCTSDLEQLTRLSVILEPTRRKRSNCRAFSVLRDVFTSLHRALCSSILCGEVHDVSLQLATQLAGLACKDDVDAMLGRLHLEAAISFEKADGLGIKRFWDEVKIKPAVWAENAPSPSPPNAEPAFIRKDSKKPRGVWFEMVDRTAKKRFWEGARSETEPSSAKRRKRVAFSVAGAVSAMRGSKERTLQQYDTKIAIGRLTKQIADIAFIKTPDDDAGADATTPLVNLCAALRTAPDAKPVCYGHIVDQERKDRHFQIYPVGTLTDNDTSAIVTLHDILSRKQGLRPLIRLQDRVRLALSTASSVLQLSNTPWLPVELTNEKVHFFRRGESIEYHRPFLLRSFPADARGAAKSAAGPSRSSTPMTTRNSTLFALGVLLLEIILGSTLDQLRGSGDHEALGGEESAIDSDAFTANRLLERRVALINPVYKVVVERCIDCTEPQDFEHEDFRQKVYTDVVMELETILEYTKLGT